MSPSSNHRQHHAGRRTLGAGRGSLIVLAVGLAVRLRLGSRAIASLQALRLVRDRCSLLRVAASCEARVILMPLIDEQGIPTFPLIAMLKLRVPSARIAVVCRADKTCGSALAAAIRAGAEEVLFDEYDCTASLGRILRPKPSLIEV